MPRRSFLPALRLLLLLPVILTGCASAMTEAAQPQDGVQLLPADGSSFYYYASGEKIPLQPSPGWIAVQFASTDPAEQSAALEDSLVDSGEPARELPTPGWALLAVRADLAPQALIEGINALRLDRTGFRQVNPVFETDDAMMIVTDQFIATFPAEQGKEEIDRINSSQHVEIVEALLGQANTFVLRVTDEAGMDALSMANLYQETGLARDAAPNFIRIVQR
jgi:hypothetical protein